MEAACGIANTMMGETIENVSKGMDTYSYKQPVGVFAGVTPFNFPAMIPLWVRFMTRGPLHLGSD